MNGLQRCTAVLNGQVPDCVPIAAGILYPFFGRRLLLLISVEIFLLQASQEIHWPQGPVMGTGRNPYGELANELVLPKRRKAVRAF